MRGSALLFGLFLISPTAAAWGPQLEAGVQADAADDHSEERRRILRVEGGRIVRAKTRRGPGGWEARIRGRWTVVENVTSARVERELLAQARTMGKGLGGTDFARRASYARWLGEKGLFAEAISELDRILRSAPDNAPALAVVREVALEPELEGDAGNAAERVQALVKFGAGASPAGREVAAARLGDMQRVVDLEKLVSTELRGRNHLRRGFAAHLARRLLPGQLPHQLANRAVLDGHRSVRTGAALALRDAEDIAVLGPAINALGSEKANVRANAAEALGWMGYPAAVEPLAANLAALQAGGAPPGTRANIYLGSQTAYVMDYDVEIAQGSSIADPIVAVQDSGAVLDVRTVVQMTKVVEMRTLMASLERLTGAGLGNRPQAWLAWWEENQANWRSKQLAAATPETAR